MIQEKMEFERLDGVYGTSRSILHFIFSKCMFLPPHCRDLNIQILWDVMEAIAFM